LISKSLSGKYARFYAGVNNSCVSVEKAAEKLNLSIRAIQNRLKRGTLKGQKIKHGASERLNVLVFSQIGKGTNLILQFYKRLLA
jgi:hypothetical protein